MQITTKKDELRLALAARRVSALQGRGFRVGIEALDEMAPNGEFQVGAVHELLGIRQAIPTSFALMLARAAQKSGGAIVWNDPAAELYLPALAAAKIDLRHLILLHCENRTDQLWAMAECLRCRGVSATVSFIERLSQIEARRLQLAAERGGGVGIFLRPYMPQANTYYAAATRWLIQPAPGRQDVQQWKVELLHGHGGQIGKVLLLEVDRETRQCRPSTVHPSTPLADRPASPPPARASA